MVEKNKIPNPGSEEAIAQGCICPVLDNYYGEGFMWGGKKCFWANDKCPLHSKKKDNG